MTRAPNRVVVVGAGFAGLNVAKALRGAPVELTLIDQRNYHTFQPLLYQVATAAMDAGDVAHHVRDVLHRHRQARFRLGRVVGMDLATKEVMLADGERLPYDQLVLAPGAVYHDFGVPGAHEHAFVLKSVAESVALRSHLLRCFERAARDASEIDKGILTVAIVGGGPTGVEMAGALVELLDRVLPKDFPELDLSRARVVLLEAAGQVLGPYHPNSQRYVEQVLRRRGVDLRLGTAVAEVRADRLILQGGEELPYGTLLWAAGVRAHPLVEVLGVPLDRAGRVPVNADLSLPQHPEVWVVGDAAGPIGSGRTFPQVAQVAIQQGKRVAKNVVARGQGRPTTDFRYRDFGQMAIVGRSAGVAELSPALSGLRMRGFLGWLAWLFIHLVYLPGHQNRLRALLGWAYEWLTYDRHARLILEPMERDLDRAAAPHVPTPPRVPTTQPPTG